MQKVSRVQKSILNAKVGLIFYFLTIVVLFYSRKVFLDYLGPEFIGLTGTLNSVLSMLNLAEFGIANSISYFLYRPIIEGNHKRINEIISVCGYMYRIVGTFILTAGIIISFFFPFWFNSPNISLPLVYFVFYCILCSALITYFINFKNQLLIADQKQYLIQGYFQSGNIIKNIIQIIISLYWGNLFVWISMEFLYSTLCCIVLNYRIRKEYPWLEASVAYGKTIFKDNLHILQKCKQVGIYNIKYFLLNKSEELFVFAFVSLKMVAYFGNYVLIVSKLLDFIHILFRGMLSSVGNLVAEGNEKRIKGVFWELLSILYFMATLVVSGIFFYISPVISFWLGEEYILSPWIVLLLCLNSYIYIGHLGIYYFNNAYGNYHDIWASWAEAALNISVTCIAAWKLGIAGVLLGKFISTLLFLSIWKPKMLCGSNFNESLTKYARNISVYALLTLIFIGGIKFMQTQFPLQSYKLDAIIMNIILCYIPTLLLFMFLYIRIAPGAQLVVTRIKDRFNLNRILNNKNR